LINFSLFASQIAKQKSYHLLSDLLHLIENTIDRNRIYINPSSYPNSNPTLNLTLKRNNVFGLTSFFNQEYRYPFYQPRKVVKAA